MLIYLAAVIVLSFVVTFLVIFGIWLVAHTDAFFCFIKEGQGVIIVHGGSFHRIIIAYDRHTCRVVKNRWMIAEGKTKYSNGILGLLEKRFGIYWVGVYPFYQRMVYEFRWNEWEQKEVKDDVVELHLKYRKDRTKYFYAQTFNYALLLSGAETGSSKVFLSGAKTRGLKKSTTRIGGNISVDIKITLLVRILYPQVAILQNEDWFEQMEAVVLDHARLYVGSRTFEELHTLARSVEGQETKNEFCEYIMKLNKNAPIGDTTASIVDAFGVKIIGAQIRSIDLAGDSKKLADATTAIYVAEQKAESMITAATAKSKEIRLIGDAEAYAIEARTKTIASFGEAGLHVERQRAIIEAGKAGNAIVFTNDSEPNKLLAGLILDSKGRKVK